MDKAFIESAHDAGLAVYFNAETGKYESGHFNDNSSDSDSNGNSEDEFDRY